MPTSPRREAPRILLTAGPTHEPIDAVRFIGNRSSGRLGVALADAGAADGWDVRLLLGPTHLAPGQSGVHVERFATTSDLGRLLEAHQPWCDVLIMAAAVADYRPKADAEQLRSKLKRGSQAIAIELEPTEDLLAGCSARRRPGQLLVGFALEPRDRLLSSAREKLARKGIDLIIANPLGTMESDSIEAVALGPGGFERSPGRSVTKAEFAGWLLALVREAIASRGSSERPEATSG